MRTFILGALAALLVFALPVSAQPMQGDLVACSSGDGVFTIDWATGTMRTLTTVVQPVTCSACAPLAAEWARRAVDKQ